MPRSPATAGFGKDELPRMIGALAAVQTPVGELIRFLAVTGWRISEARLLTWDAVVFSSDGVFAALDDTKAGRQDRQLAADAAVLIDRQPHRLGYVFSNSNGRKPIDYRAVLATLGEVCHAAGVKRITPHVLRHTAATHAAIAGSEAHELRVAFGWKTLTMTSVYVSRAEALGRKGAERAASRINIFRKPAAGRAGAFRPATPESRKQIAEAWAWVAKPAAGR
jgi:integrase